MSSRYGAARPKRAGEQFARANHADEDAAAEPGSKKVKFDGSAATKRGAVNIDGYDSDSDREELGARPESKMAEKDKDEDMDDMFAEADEDETEDRVDDTTTKKSKEVRFLDGADIEGQDMRSRDTAQIRLDGQQSDDEDEEEIALAIQEEDLDEEVGAGGLKKHAPKVEAFNLRAEEEEGRFDESGNFVRNAADRDAQHDRWLEGVSKKEMKKAAEAHEKREAELRQKRKEDGDILTSDLLKSLIMKLELGETALEALARLGRGQAKSKKVPKWKQKKMKPEGMDVDSAEKEDPEQVRIKEAIDAITDAADKLLSRDRPDVYDRERELLVREWSRETQEPWVEPRRETAADEAAPTKMWEYRWVDGRDGAPKQGPYDGPTMEAWQRAGYFGDGVEFRSRKEASLTPVIPLEHVPRQLPILLVHQPDLIIARRHHSEIALRRAPLLLPLIGRAPRAVEASLRRGILDNLVRGRRCVVHAIGDVVIGGSSRPGHGVIARREPRVGVPVGQRGVVDLDDATVATAAVAVAFAGDFDSVAPVRQAPQTPTARLDEEDQRCVRILGESGRDRRALDRLPAAGADLGPVRGGFCWTPSETVPCSAHTNPIWAWKKTCTVDGDAPLSSFKTAASLVVRLMVWATSTMVLEPVVHLPVDSTQSIIASAMHVTPASEVLT
ncbi:Lin1 family protein [Apiospora phragmitis]|uniref:Lin1 family protein n=1 Tax=Apiospora phragmitis TaxID=2905665 RepID=A0ABR1WTC3_9PEZI